MNDTPISVGEAFVAAMADHGIDYFFGNAGTDFAPVIEAFAKAAALGQPAPTPIAIPHENTAMGMAHGYYLATGRPQGVMVHTTVGTANAVCGLMNAARQNVPVLLFAGRTPITEAGAYGARNRVIQWAQESFDQAGMVREYVKWDYELRRPDQTSAALDRAMALAMSEPRGPIYMTLPREVLASPAEPAALAPAKTPASPPGADPDALADAADFLANAKAPLIITTTVGRYPDAPETLAALAETFAIPVVMHWPRYVCLPVDHPMHAGFAPGPALEEADFVLVVDSDVPWIPAIEGPADNAKVVQLGIDPLYGDYPLRTFAADVVINANPVTGLKALHAALGDRLDPKSETVATRRKAHIAKRATQRATIARDLDAVKDAAPMSPAWVTHCIDRIKGDDAILVNESPLQQDHLTLTEPGSFFSASPVGGLGWGMGAALGLKLGAPDKLVIAALGDGAYMFGNPTSAHFVSRALDLPILIVIFNNRMWGAVSRATKFMYPDGYAAKSNQVPLTLLEPAPDLEKVVAASGGYGVVVDDPAALEAELVKARDIVLNEGRQAVVNVITQGV
ncbi:MAG: thiamine pyrophosphate-requiring protein [Alphaproteobacteria bacterium]